MQGKRVLVRADLNVPMRDGHISDMTRVERVGPTIQEIADKGGRVVILSHFERPKGKRVPEMSLAAAGGGDLPRCCASRWPSPMTASARWPRTRSPRLQDGEVLLLENTRFHKGEEENDPDFAKPRWRSSATSM